jgi:hypothetical protein
MKIEVREDYTIQLEEVYNPITIKTRDGLEFHICQRDYGIEVSCNGKTKYLDESLGENKEEGVFTTTLTNSGLVSLDEHNSEAWDTRTGWFSNEPKPNGIECPECGEELMDTNPNETLISYPAKKNVHCPKCEYRGYRII